jgi:hypothetical protein
MTIRPRARAATGATGPLPARAGLVRRRLIHSVQDTLARCLLAPICVLCLIWPALWNGYPIVFSDTGTYLSQAMHRYLGWDRPPFYSLFLLPLHHGQTTWPVVMAQAALTVLTLDLTRRALGVSRWWLLVLTVFLATASSLPWIVSELMPDLFTPLLVLLLTLLVFARARLWPWERVAVGVLAAFMIVAQQSSVPLACGLLIVLIPMQWVFVGSRLAPRTRPRSRAMLAALSPLLVPGCAIAALVAVNFVGFGRLSLSPYGNVFVLARVIYDGPGMTVLRRDCPDRGWALCPYLDRFPPSVDQFLWTPDSPIMLAGGHKAVSADADAIIRAAMAANPGMLLAAGWNNTIEQLTRFDSGDGLERNWTAQVGPWIDRDFPPRESAAFHAARQQMGLLEVPPALLAAHRIVALAGIAAAFALLPLAWRRRHMATWFLIVSLVTLPLSAAITGGLSVPHDRYQSRIVWLPAAMALLTMAALLPRRRGR